MPLKPCIKAATNLAEQDVDAVLEGFDAYRGSMDQDTAAGLAVDDALASAEQERSEYLELIYETHPDLKPAEPDPQPAVAIPDDPAFSVEIGEEEGQKVAKVKIDRGLINRDADNFGYPTDTTPIPDGDPRLEDTQKKYTIPGSQHDELPPGTLDYTPERKAKHEEWIQAYLDEGLTPEEIEEEEGGGPAPKPIAVLTGGGGASGKGTILKILQGKGEIPVSGFVHVDPDLIKTNNIPEYEALLKEVDSRAAPVVHEESSDVAKILTNRAIKQHKNIVIDKTLNDREKTLKQIQDLKDEGYDVVLVGVTIDIDEALIRALGRYYGSGRLPLVSHMVNAHIAFNNYYPEYAAVVDSARVFDNTGQPALVMSAEAGQVEINDEILYNRTRKRGTIDGKSKTLRQVQTPVEDNLEEGAGPGDQSPGDRGSEDSQAPDGKTPPEVTLPEPGEFISRSAPLEAKPKNPIQHSSIERLIEDIKIAAPGTRGISFNVFETQEEALGEGSVERDGRIQGGFYAGTNEILLISENIPTVSALMTVLRHEMVGHYGMRKVLGKDFDRLLGRVYRARNGDLKEAYEWVARNYPALVAANDVASIADEMLARTAETDSGKPSAFLTRIYDEIIRLLNKVGLVGKSISRAEVQSLIRSSERSLRRNSQRHKPVGRVGSEVAARVDDANDAPTDGNLGMPEETLKNKFVRLAQDSFNRVKALQAEIVAQGGTVSHEADVYGAEERSSGKIAARLRNLDQDYMQPLLEFMDDNKVSLEELDQWLIAKHAQERNAYIASINDDMQDGGSGMTNQEAQDILDVPNDRKALLDRGATFVYAVNDQHLDDMVAGGHLPQEVVDTWRDRWDNYVPLKGKEGEEGRPGTGSGYSVMGAGIQKAMGRGAGNLAESPTAHSFAQAEATIVRTEKTKVGQALIQLIRENPDPNFWTITQRNYKRFEDQFGEPFEGYDEAPEGMIENLDYHRVTNSEGKIVFKLNPNYKNRDDVFAVMFDGQELLVQIKDPVLMEQLKKMNTTQLNAVVAGFGTVNRYLAMINTALNPEFVITNFERDFQTAMVNVGGEWSARIAAKVAKNIPGAVRGIWQSTFDTKGQSPWRDLYDEMAAEGGTIGFFGLEDIDTKVKQIQKRLINRHGVLGRTKRSVTAVRDIVLDANLSVENAARLAAYKVIKEESIANGLSTKEAKAKAASVAKNLTVNFNRKGELAPVLNSAYLFYNASIQGSARIITALSNPRVRKIAGAIAATSFALAMYNRAAGGDDDDDIAYWDKISDYTKQTNLIIMHPDGSGNYSKIRLPYGYNVFYYAGTAMNDLMFGRKTVTETTMNMLSAVMNAFNPIQGADLLDTVTPTFLKPVEQDMRNINFMGAPIKPDNPFDNYDRPESDKAFKSTNPMLKEMMAALNEVTGGDQTHSGLIDISPEIIKHYVSWLTGGAGMTATRALGTAINLATDEEIDMKNVPFARTLGGKPGSHFDTQRFYDSIKEVNAVQAQLKLFKGTDDWQGYKEDHQAVHKLAFQAKKYQTRIRKLRDDRDKAYADDDIDLANEKREAIRQQMMEFSLLYDQAAEADE